MNKSIDLLNKVIQKRKVWNPRMLGDSKISGSEPLKKSKLAPLPRQKAQNTKISMDTKAIEAISRMKQEFRKN